MLQNWCHILWSFLTFLFTVCAISKKTWTWTFFKAFLFMVHRSYKVLGQHWGWATDDIQTVIGWTFPLTQTKTLDTPHSLPKQSNTTQTEHKATHPITQSHTVRMATHNITSRFVGRHTNWPFLLTAPVSAGTVNIISRIHPVSLLVWIFHDRKGWENRSARSFSLSGTLWLRSLTVNHRGRAEWHTCY